MHVTRELGPRVTFIRSMRRQVEMVVLDLLGPYLLLVVVLAPYILILLPYLIGA
jgi:hypothetical protein